MNILLIGGGGREHALASKLSESKLCTQIFIAPGNPGTAQIGTNIDISVNDFEKQINYSLDKFTEANYLNKRFFADFSQIYMFQMGMLMHLKVEQEDIRGMQAKGNTYAQHHYFEGKKP